MATTACPCGHTSIGHPDNVTVTSVLCGAACMAAGYRAESAEASRMAEADMAAGAETLTPWRPGLLYRLDDWCHSSRLPEWSWRWVCNLHERNARRGLA